MPSQYLRRTNLKISSPSFSTAELRASYVILWRHTKKRLAEAKHAEGLSLAQPSINPFNTSRESLKSEMSQSFSSLMDLMEIRAVLIEAWSP